MPSHLTMLVVNTFITLLLVVTICDFAHLLVDFEFQVLTVGALHQADSEALRKAASAWHDELASLPKPLLVVNIGGPSSNYFAFPNLLWFIS